MRNSLVLHFNRGDIRSGPQHRANLILTQSGSSDWNELGTADSDTYTEIATNDSDSWAETDTTDSDSWTEISTG